MEELVIWGAGAIGGAIGAALARSGKDPLLVDSDPAHVAALNTSGLTITGPIEEFSTPARALAPDKVRGPLRRVMLAVKGSTHGGGRADDRAAACRRRLGAVAAERTER
jgi:2-dehydropantoate 2-reductase